MWDTAKEYEVDQAINDGLALPDTIYDTPNPGLKNVTWFDPDVDEDCKDLQVNMGCLFQAQVCWNDTGDRDLVYMATYDTEGLPEDEMVTFSWGSYETWQELVEDIKNHNDDFYVLDCDLFDGN